MGLLWLIYLVSCADRSCYVSRLPSKKNTSSFSVLSMVISRVLCDSSTHPPKNPLGTSTWKVELGSLSLWVERIIAADPTAAFISKRTGQPLPLRQRNQVKRASNGGRTILSIFDKWRGKRRNKLNKLNKPISSYLKEFDEPKSKKTGKQSFFPFGKLLELLVWVWETERGSI